MGAVCYLGLGLCSPGDAPVDVLLDLNIIKEFKMRGTSRIQARWEIFNVTNRVNLGNPQTIKVGDALLGRIVDGFGEPIDHKGPIESAIQYPVRAAAPDPLLRPRVTRILQTGVRAS